MRVEIISDEIHGGEVGFLSLRRVRVVNVHDDGRRTEPYLCDMIERPKGIDAVVLAIYTRRAGGPTRVLLRDGLRLPLHVGRPAGGPPIPDARPYLFFRECVAGIIEEEDRGEEGIRRRAAVEAWEEAGLTVAPAAVRLLGAGTFPAAGIMAEKFWLAAVEVESEAAATPSGDGTPMEEGASLVWMELEEAIRACVAGEIEDAKTEITLRRLKDAL